MKTERLQTVYNMLKEDAVDAFYKAIEAHGTSYSFEGRSHELPCIPLYGGEVTIATVSDYPHVIIRNEKGEEKQEHILDLTADDIIYIVSLIEETDEVKDVDDCCRWSEIDLLCYKLEAAENGVRECLKGSNVHFRAYGESGGLSFWASEVEKLRSEMESITKK